MAETGIRGINAIKPDYTVPFQGGEGCVSFEKNLSFPYLIGIGTVIGGGGDRNPRYADAEIHAAPFMPFARKGIDNAVLKEEGEGNKIKMRGYGIGRNRRRKIKAVERSSSLLRVFLFFLSFLPFFRERKNEADIFFPRIADSTIDSDRYNRAPLVITFLYGDGV